MLFICLPKKLQNNLNHLLISSNNTLIIAWILSLRILSSRVDNKFSILYILSNSKVILFLFPVNIRLYILTKITKARKIYWQFIIDIIYARKPITNVYRMLCFFNKVYVIWKFYKWIKDAKVYIAVSWAFYVRVCITWFWVWFAYPIMNYPRI